MTFVGCGSEYLDFHAVAKTLQHLPDGREKIAGGRRQLSATRQPPFARLHYGRSTMTAPGRVGRLVAGCGVTN